jgi:TPR repeat protein
MGVTLYGLPVRGPDGAREAAALGTTTAMLTELAFMHLDGKTGVVHDTGRAVALFRIAAFCGYAPAQQALATCYHDGTGVCQNTNLGALWERNAQSFSNQIS